MRNLASAKLDQAAELKRSLHERLRELSRLSRNWDGYGAPPIDPTILASAQRFVQSLPDKASVRPLVVPMSPGNLQFEWHQGARVLELEFEDAQTIRYLQWDPERGIEEESTFPASDTARAVELIHWFMGGACV